MTAALMDRRHEQKQKRLARSQIDSVIETVQGLDKTPFDPFLRQCILVLLYTATNLLSGRAAKPARIAGEATP